MREGRTLKPEKHPGDQLGLRGLWIFVGLALLGLAGTSAVVLAGLGQGDQPPFLSANHREQAPAPRPPSSQALHLAGSGTNIPLTRRLADAFGAQHPGHRVVVHESIGSGGGIRAVADGAISLGLISRPLQPAERSLHLRVVPYARVAVVIATHPGVADEPMDPQRLLALYRGARPTWSSGTRVRVIQRERGDSSHRAVARALPGFAAVDHRARRAHRWRVVYSDSSMREALLATPGSVGLFDLGAILSQQLPLRVLAYEGQRPTAAAPLPRGYPFHKDLAFVSGQTPTALASLFLRFVASSAGARVIGRHGYVPLPGGRP